MGSRKISVIGIWCLVALLSGIPCVYAQSGFGEGARKRWRDFLRLDAKKHYGPGEYQFSLSHQGLERMYKVYVPLHYQRSDPSPLVMAFHGGGGNAQSSIDFFRLNATADRENFIVVYPQGTGKKIRGKVFASWNAGKCCPPASQRKVDDVGFIAKMLDELSKKFSIDTQRVYATGFSNGALMCYRLACELSDRIIAIAAGGAHDAFDNCHPRRPVPLLHFHGTLDQCARYEGGTCGGCFAEYLIKLGLPADAADSQWQCRSVAGYVEQWSRMNGCGEEKKVIYQKGSATCHAYTQCRDNAEVVLCTLEGSGHTWPGGSYGNKICDQAPDSFACREWKETVGQVNSDFSANDMLWEFFKGHPKK